MTTYPQITDLPVGVIADDVELTVAAEPTVGQVVATYTRGRIRVARVVKVGPKRVTVEYTTPGAIKTAFEIAETNRVDAARKQAAHDYREAARYLATVEVMEQLGIEPSDGFVPIASLPREYVVASDAMRNPNYARTTIVHTTEQLRKWAQSHLANAERVEAPEHLGALAAYDELSLIERARQHVHMTTKNCKREDIFELPAGVIA